MNDVNVVLKRNGKTFSNEILFIQRMRFDEYSITLLQIRFHSTEEFTGCFFFKNKIKIYFIRWTDVLNPTITSIPPTYCTQERNFLFTSGALDMKKQIVHEDKEHNSHGNVVVMIIATEESHFKLFFNTDNHFT